MSASIDTCGEAGVFVVDEQYRQRLDRALTDALPALSRTQVQQLIEAGHVTVNGKKGRAGQKLERGEEVTWSGIVLPSAAPPATAESIPLDVVYEDEHLLVINKPRGLVVHPAPGHRSGTLVNAVLGHTAGELPLDDEDSDAAALRPGIVHRLDKDTSGLLVVAKTEAALRSLQQQIAERTVERHYIAVVYGSPRFERATVDAPIGRHPTDRKRMTVLPLGSHHQHRPARTELQVVERFSGLALLECRLYTGRTHQIRVHCAYVHLPVVGDATYGARRAEPERVRAESEVHAAVAALEGQALHAFRLAFDHPVSGERVCCVAPVPPDYQRLLDVLDSRWRST